MLKPSPAVAPLRWHTSSRLRERVTVKQIHPPTAQLHNIRRANSSDFRPKQVEGVGFVLSSFPLLKSRFLFRCLFCVIRPLGGCPAALPASSPFRENGSHVGRNHDHEERVWIVCEIWVLTSGTGKWGSLESTRPGRGAFSFKATTWGSVAHAFFSRILLGLMSTGIDLDSLGRKTLRELAAARRRKAAAAGSCTGPRRPRTAHAPGTRPASQHVLPRSFRQSEVCPPRWALAGCQL